MKDEIANLWRGYLQTALAAHHDHLMEKRKGEIVTDEKIYELRWNAEGELSGCECCGFATKLGEFRQQHPNTGTNLFCEVCSSSHLSLAETHPWAASDPLLYRSLGWIANRILQEIAEINT